jgi:hypothetical protein
MAKKAHRVKRRVASRCGDKVCFHGAFVKASDAKKKAAKIKGARVKGFYIRRGDYRFGVVTSKKG